MADRRFVEQEVADYEEVMLPGVSRCPRPSAGLGRRFAQAQVRRLSVRVVCGDVGAGVDPTGGRVAQRRRQG